MELFLYEVSLRQTYCVSYSFSQSLAKDARFEQIWKSRKGNKETEHEKALQEICNFYDIVRVEEQQK